MFRRGHSVAGKAQIWVYISTPEGLKEAACSAVDRAPFEKGVHGIGRDCPEGGVGPRACVAGQFHPGVLIASLIEEEQFLP